MGEEDSWKVSLLHFGGWDDPEGALQRYLDQRDDLHAGRTPRASGDGLTVRDLANQLLTAKKRQAEAGEISLRTFQDYHSTCRRVVETFGAVKNQLQRILLARTSWGVR